MVRRLCPVKGRDICGRLGPEGDIPRRTSGLMAQTRAGGAGFPSRNSPLDGKGYRIRWTVPGTLRGALSAERPRERQQDWSCQKPARENSEGERVQGKHFEDRSACHGGIRSRSLLSSIHLRQQNSRHSNAGQRPVTARSSMNHASLLTGEESKLSSPSQF